MVLYVFRAIAYETPFYGGRAQGTTRPRAPTLTKRPNGRKRTFSIGGQIANGSVSDTKEEEDEDGADDLTEEGC